MNGERDSSIDVDDLLQARMLNEYCYCPRLFHLMRVEGRWVDNEHTVDGKIVHRAIDRVEGHLPSRDCEGDSPFGSEDESEVARAPSAADESPPSIVRSITIASVRLGLVAKLDLVEVDGERATPVDYKRGQVPDNELQSWEPERVQLMAQALLLREQGYACERGILYFASSRRRVEVLFDDALEARTLELLRQARTAARRRVAPPPLAGSPKCVGCSLSGVCLPDETDALLRIPVDAAAPGVRRLYPARPDALPLYVQDPGATVGKSDQSLVVRQRGGAETRVLLKDVSQLVVMGPVQVTAQAMHLLCEAGIPIVHLSSGGWFYGITTGFALRNSFGRVAQYEAAGDPVRVLECAKEFVLAKLQNQRTLLKRNAALEASDTLQDLDAALRSVPRCHDLLQLLGVEGSGAAGYFRRFNSLLRSPIGPFEFESRNRRPPRDPVNAMLSFLYAMLAKEVTVAIAAEGLDPWWGLYHQPRHGRPALALDLMEEFRPIIADSAVITAVNTGMLGPEDFVMVPGSCALKPSARKALLRAFEARLDQMVTHPTFDYRCSWRQIVVLQVRLFCKWLRRELPRYRGMTTR